MGSACVWNNFKDLDEKKKGKNFFFSFGLISHHQTTSGTTQNLDNYPKRIFLCKAKIQKRPASPAHSPACLNQFELRNQINRTRRPVRLVIAVQFMPKVLPRSGGIE